MPKTRFIYVTDSRLHPDATEFRPIPLPNPPPPDIDGVENISKILHYKNGDYVNVLALVRKGSISTGAGGSTLPTYKLYIYSPNNERIIGQFSSDYKTVSQWNFNAIDNRRYHGGTIVDTPWRLFRNSGFGEVDVLSVTKRLKRISPDETVESIIIVAVDPAEPWDDIDTTNRTVSIEISGISFKNTISISEMKNVDYLPFVSTINGPYTKYSYGRNEPSRSFAEIIPSRYSASDNLFSDVSFSRPLSIDASRYRNNFASYANLLRTEPPDPGEYGLTGQNNIKSYYRYDFSDYINTDTQSRKESEIRSDYELLTNTEWEIKRLQEEEDGTFTILNDTNIDGEWKIVFFRRINDYGDVPYSTIERAGSFFWAPNGLGRGQTVIRKLGVVAYAGYNMSFRNLESVTSNGKFRYSLKRQVRTMAFDFYNLIGASWPSDWSPARKIAALDDMAIEDYTAPDYSKYLEDSNSRYPCRDHVASSFPLDVEPGQSLFNIHVYPIGRHSAFDAVRFWNGISPIKVTFRPLGSDISSEQIFFDNIVPVSSDSTPSPTMLIGNENAITDLPKPSNSNFLSPTYFHEERWDMGNQAKRYDWWFSGEDWRDLIIRYIYSLYYDNASTQNRVIDVLSIDESSSLTGLDFQNYQIDISNLSIRSPDEMVINDTGNGLNPVPVNAAASYDVIPYKNFYRDLIYDPSENDFYSMRLVLQKAVDGPNCTNPDYAKRYVRPVFGQNGRTYYYSLQKSKVGVWGPVLFHNPYEELIKNGAGGLQSYRDYRTNNYLYKLPPLRIKLPQTVSVVSKYIVEPHASCFISIIPQRLSDYNIVNKTISFDDGYNCFAICSKLDNVQNSQNILHKIRD